MKKQTIGFKDCADTEENNQNKEGHIETPADLEKHIEEKIIAQQEFQEHMSDYEKLRVYFYRAKIGLIITGIIIAIVSIFYSGYVYGAYRQEAGNGPYKTIVTATGQKYIVSQTNSSN